jgi:hypothetical protein
MQALWGAGSEATLDVPKKELTAGASTKTTKKAKK